MEAETIKVLLIEDNSDDVQLILRKLNKSINARFKVSTASSLQQGLEYLARNAPDLILSDLGLPDSHGLDTVTKLMCGAPQIPLVVLSGFNDEAIAIKAVKAGAQDYLVKGQLEGYQIERSLSYAIERSHLQRELEQHTQEICKVQNNLLKILDKNADAIIVVGEGKKILFANPAAESMLGRKKKELIDQPFSFPLNKGKTTEIEISRPDKEYIVGEMNVVGIDWEGKHAFLASLRDVTERKRAEIALKESEEKFSKAFHSSPEAVVISTIEDGILLEVNDSFHRLTGYTAEETRNKSATELNIWVDPEQRSQMIKTLKEKGMISNQEYSFRKKSGELRTWLFSAESINFYNQPCLISISTDITERKKAEEVLRFSDAAFKSIHESVIAMDTKYVITHWNDICEQMYGIRSSEAIGKKLQDVIEIVEEHPGENEKRFKTLEANGYYQEEQLHRTRQGEVWVDASFQSIESDNERYGWVILASAITQRKLAEEALKRSEEKYRELISTSIDAIVSFDQKMRIMIWNQGAERIFGYTENEMLGQSFMKLVPERDHKKIEEQKAEIDRTDPDKGPNFILEVTALKKDKTEVPIELSISSRKTDDNHIVTAIMRDITERKEAEEKIQKQNEFLNNVLESVQHPFFVINAEDYSILMANSATNAGDLSKKPTCHAITHNTGKLCNENEHLCPLKEMKRTKKSVVVEHIHYDKNNNKRNVEVHGYPILDSRGNLTRMIEYTLDVTERKVAEEALRKSEEQYRDLFENASDLIQSCDFQGKFIYVNQAWFDQLGYTEEELDSLNSRDIIHPDVLPHCEETLCDVFSGKSNKNVETTFVAKDGRLIHVEGNVNPVFEGEKVVATRAIFRDITERKMAEEKLRKIDEMKSEFLSNVSHELRTPLQSISGFTKLILDGKVPEAETQQEFLQIIDSETQHLGNLIGSLLDMSRLESGRFEINKKLIPIKENIADSLKSLQSLAREKHISLTEDIPAQLPEMEVDGARLRQVIINLLSNAIKYSDPGGSVHVKVAQQPDQLTFQVSDHGIGMSEEALQHLFERFYRAEDKLTRGGTGLGLYISKQIIEAHGGQIWAESKLNEGSTFNFTLPLNGKGEKGNGQKNPGNRRRPGNIKTGELLPQS